MRNPMNRKSPPGSAALTGLKVVASLLFLTSTLRAADPVVSNVQGLQQPGTKLVDITYDVKADTPTVGREVEPVHIHIPQQDPDGDFTWLKFSFSEINITGGPLYEAANLTTCLI
jgi:hypothetical protein